MSGLTKDQVTYQVAMWALKDPEVLKRVRMILAGALPDRIVLADREKNPTYLLALFIGDIVHTNGNGFASVTDSGPSSFWSADAVSGLREVVSRGDFYVTGVDWDAVAEELAPE